FQAALGWNPQRSIEKGFLPPGVDPALLPQSNFPHLPPHPFNAKEMVQKFDSNLQPIVPASRPQSQPMSLPIQVPRPPQSQQQPIIHPGAFALGQGPIRPPQQIVQRPSVPQ